MWWLSTLLLLLLSVALVSASARSPSYYYDECVPTTCGASVMRWPFGEGALCRSAAISTACENGSVVITDESSQRRYKLLEALNDTVYARRSVGVVDLSLFGCGEIPPYLGTESDDWMTLGSFSMSPGFDRETLYNCTRAPAAGLAAGLRSAPCLECGATDNSCYFYDGYGGQLPGCQGFRINIPDSVYTNLSKVGNLRRALEKGFSVQWDGACGEQCASMTGGRCGYLDGQTKKGSEVCFCSSGVHRYNCSDGVLIDLSNRSPATVKIIITAIVIVSSVLLVAICYLFVRRYHRNRKRMEQRGHEEQALRRYLDSRTQPSIESFLQNYTSGMPTKFSFKQLKKYSCNFNDKLGQGGFGSVYKATLTNGCVVAVKVLDETEQSEMQFLNEVQTIGRIHHDHLVRLLGYCFERSKRALIYEYMEKGSLNKYIHKRHQDPPERLSLLQLHEIALGTAKGIAYLHEECRNRILHCDIKPHNILLDDKFQPKVSDFGLAQIVNREHSHISLACGRGTPGYAPPEMWWKNYGPVTEKSDVYSFGMVVLEMVGQRRNFEGDMSKSSEAYFPEWAFLHMVKGNDGGSLEAEQLECHGLEEKALLRRMVLVGLWCIQYAPPRRPSMRKVIEMLEGNAVIDTPPIPFDAMPSRIAPVNQVTEKIQ